MVKTKYDKSGLSPKQETFCIEFAKCGNARQAYLKAGYAHNKDSTVDVNACRLLKNAKVKARLAELADEVKDDSIADIKEMQIRLTQIIRQELCEEVLVTEGYGVGMTKTMKENKKPATKDVINAINSLGKMQGAFVDKVEVETDMNLNIKVDYGDDDE